MIPADASTATGARHAAPYSALVDHLYSAIHYQGRHIYTGRHALTFDSELDQYVAEQTAHALWCIDADPLLPWGKHVGRAAA